MQFLLLSDHKHRQATMLSCPALLLMPARVPMVQVRMGARPSLLLMLTLRLLLKMVMVLG